MGEVLVPADRYWGAQTQRSCMNFRIGVGIETMPAEIIHAFGVLKQAAARANHRLLPEKMTEEKLSVIETAAGEVAAGTLDGHFPLVVWQTGSGTQSNMNANEVIANRANELAGEKRCHPNDDVNMSQSSNDTFPTAMHIAAVLGLEKQLIPAAETLIRELKRLEAENTDVVKSGRTHLQDAVPIGFSQEISGWRSSVERDLRMLKTGAGTAAGAGAGRNRGGNRPERPGGLRPAGGGRDFPDYGDALCAGGKQVPRPDLQRRACLRPRRGQGAGGGHDEDRKRCPLAGQRTALRPRGNPDPGERAGQLHHARKGESHPV